MDIKELTKEQRAQLRMELNAQEKSEHLKQAAAYLELRTGFISKAKELVQCAATASENLAQFMDTEGLAFGEIMKEYGQLKKDGQMTFKIDDGNFLVEVKRNKVKGFDERANIAAAKLVDFLDRWISLQGSGIDDPMYQLAMAFLERNRHGDYDDKSIRKLYAMESKFNKPEYSEIMRMFQESNKVERTAINYYFQERDSRGVWRKIEPSFNRM